jgi:hypothetical protein
LQWVTAPDSRIRESAEFYEALGFEKRLESDVVIFRIGRSEFLLQARFETAWAANCMCPV